MIDISPKEAIENYIKSGMGKVSIKPLPFFLLSFLGGAFTAFSAAATSTAAFSVASGGLVRLINGMIFPLGFIMAILLGNELFLGNNLLVMNVLEKKMKISQMLKIIFFSYIGNLIGAGFIAYLCGRFQQLDFGGGEMLLYSMKVALTKSGYGFSKSFVLGFLCNMLVAAGVIIINRSGQVLTRVISAYIPVFLFVTSGFENSIANFFYVPVGIFAKSNPSYMALAVEAGISVNDLTWGNFIMGNLLPVSLGNMLGGLCIGVICWAIYIRKEKAL